LRGRVRNDSGRKDPKRNYGRERSLVAFLDGKEEEGISLRVRRKQAGTLSLMGEYRIIVMSDTKGTSHQQVSAGEYLSNEDWN